MKPESLALLVEGSHKMGVKLGKTELDQFDKFIALLQKWTRKISLTAIREEKDIVIKHILDSLLLHDRIKDSWFVLDIGSGNGCPGIPLKIARPSIRLLMVESRGRKVSFLRTAIRELGLADSQAIQQRAEDPVFQSGLKGQLDIVTARAVAKTSKLVQAGMPYLKPTGKILLMKGSKVEEELEIAKPVIEKLKAKVESIEDLKIPETEWTRKIVTIGWK